MSNPTLSDVVSTLPQRAPQAVPAPQEASVVEELRVLRETLGATREEAARLKQDMANFRQELIRVKNDILEERLRNNLHFCLFTGLFLAAMFTVFLFESKRLLETEETVFYLRAILHQIGGTDPIIPSRKPQLTGLDIRRIGVVRNLAWIT